MIGVVTTSFPRWKGDPAGCFVHGLAAALARQGHRVEVLAPSDGGGPVDDAWHAPGLTIRRIRYAWPRRLEQVCYGAGAPENLAARPARWAAVPGLVAAMAAAIADPRYDRIMSHWLVPCGLVGAAARRGRPHLAVAHSGDVHLLARLPLGRKTALWIADRSTSVGFSAPQVMDTFLRLLGGDRASVERKCLVLPVGIDPPPDPGKGSLERDGIRKRYGLVGFSILGLGRLVPVKGYDVLIQAVSRHVPDATVVIAGQGPLADELSDQARRLKVRLVLTGVVEEADKARLFSACDVFAAPSRVLADCRSEGAPVAVIEAMAAGIPVVAAASGGMGSLVAHGRTGLLVPPDDPDLLGAALAEIRSDPDLRGRLVSAAKDLAKGREWDALLPRYEELLFPSGLGKK